MIRTILASHVIVEQSYRSCLGVMSLAKKTGGPARLEEACRQASEASPNPSYTLIKKIWAVCAAPKLNPPGAIGAKGYVRGAAHYGHQGDRK